VERREEKLYGPEYREGWGAGPWQDEPDLVIWTDPESQLVGLILRSADLGSLCGYVAVPTTHPAHPLQGAPSELQDDLEAHGGVDFSQSWGDSYVAKFYPDMGYWWLYGFACSHCMDLCPMIEQILAPHRASRRLEKDFLALFPDLQCTPDLSRVFERALVYRDIAYVEHEIHDLFKQLQAYTPAPANEPPSIFCPKCGLVSYNPNDIEQRYCGSCHEWHASDRPRTD
jgi:hypothetical protein